MALIDKIESLLCPATVQSEQSSLPGVLQNLCFPISRMPEIIYRIPFLLFHTTYKIPGQHIL